MQRSSRYRAFLGRESKSLGDGMFQRFVRYRQPDQPSFAVRYVNISGKRFGEAGFALPIATP